MGELFEAARRGDREAQAEIHRVVRAFARIVCRGRSPGGAVEIDWEDVAQEAGRKLFARGLRAYRGTGSEKSYLYTVVKATSIDLARSAERRQRREEEAEWPAPAGSVHDEAALRVKEILARLSTDCRTLVTLVFLEGCSYPKLARELGLAESSVRSKLSRCIRRARELSAAGEAP